MTLQPSSEGIEGRGKKDGDWAWEIGSPPPRAVLRQVSADLELWIINQQFAEGQVSEEALAGGWECLLESCSLGAWLASPQFRPFPAGTSLGEQHRENLEVLPNSPHVPGHQPYPLSICVLGNITHVVRNLAAAGEAWMPSLYPNDQINAFLYQLIFYYHSAVGESILYFRFPKSAKKGELTLTQQ